jgi:signal transduction histidine kinase
MSNHFAARLRDARRNLTARGEGRYIKSIAYSARFTRGASAGRFDLRADGVMSLLDRFGLDEPERLARQRFLGIAAADVENLRRLRATFASHAAVFAERFYQHLLADERASKLLTAPGLLARLKTLQADYFASLLEGVFDAAYYEARLRVGEAHQHVGLPPVLYLGAYNQYIQITFPLFLEAFAGDAAAAMPALLSLVKVIFLDVGLALDTYFHEATEQLRGRNDELQEALALYRQSQQREEQFRRLLSHEVRGGLAAVITTLDDCLDVARPDLDAGTVEQLESVTRRCWSLSNLLSEMLTTARAEGGPTWVETGRLFELLAARFGLYAEGRPIRLSLPPQPPRVWADPIQLREAFANLVSNAVRYMDKEDGRVEIRWRGAGGRELGGGHPPGEFVLFAVTDNGPGIPPNVQARIFEPFVRGPAAEGRPKGTGLGLYFVRTIVEQGGGRIWVESTPGQGTTFWFTVPRGPQ